MADHKVGRVGVVGAAGMKEWTRHFVGMGVRTRQFVERVWLARMLFVQIACFKWRVLHPYISGTGL